ncbi:helix-turn-helix domain-containing protein [Alphaproteobacteria bacterium KMM 3653]|uniref:Helix-turn-helix domain-containing protein n=1 Tax=Harenicola maris TaxID=2841044 RepID=A0AAP2CQE6_9RHOB|nr:helix-turn-helix domain-containing protein [Harenicola maris]
MEDWYSNETATFGDRVAAAREGVGLTQQELAKRLGVKLKTVHGWEDDLTEPRANKLQMLSGVLGVSLMWLLSGEGDGLDGPESTPPLDDNARALMLELRQLRGEMDRAADRMGLLEKKLRAYIGLQGAELAEAEAND